MSSIIGDFLSLVNNSDIGMESINQKGFVLSYQGPLFPDLNISLESICETTAANAKDLHPVYIILSHSASTMSNLIKKVTGDIYSHAALCLDPKFKTFYSFGTKEKDPNIKKLIDPPHGGFVTEHPDNSFYANRPNMPYAIYCVFINSKALRLLKAKLQWFIDNQNKLKYHFEGLVKIWMNRPSENNTKFFCSGFVADVLQAGGVATEKSYSLYRPQQLSELPMSYLVGQGKGYITINYRKIRENTLKAKYQYLKDIQK